MYFIQDLCSKLIYLTIIIYFTFYKHLVDFTCRKTFKISWLGMKPLSMPITLYLLTAQLAFTCSKLTIQTLAQGLKCVQS